MIARPFGFAVMLAALAAACASPSQDLTPTYATAIRDSVAIMLDAWRRYSAAGQWDSVGALYVEDESFRWIENGVVQYRSADDIRRALAGLPPTLRIETTHHDVVITALAPGLAMVVGRFQTRFADSTAQVVAFSGAFSMAVTHRTDGWRILGSHSSSPQGNTR